MTRHLILDIVPDLLRVEEWADAYDTTLRLLRAHPSRLLGHDWMMLFGTRLPAYMRSIERYPDVPAKRHWGVIGDHASLVIGDLHTMYRDLGHYRKTGGRRLPPHQDILEYALQERRVDRGGPTLVFGDKTHGGPYQIPLLAAAMVVENRFPLSAMVRGDITRAEAEAAQSFAESTLKVPVAMPVRLDGARLTARLRRFLSGEALVQAFDALCLDRAARGLPGWATPSRSAAPGPSEQASSESSVDITVLRSLDQLPGRRRNDLHALVHTVRKLQARIQALATSEPLHRSIPPPPSAHQRLAAVLGCHNPVLLRRALAQILSERGPTLTEHAWDRITREESVETLSFLVALSAVQTGTAYFFYLQRAILENPLLREYVLRIAAVHDAAPESPRPGG